MKVFVLEGHNDMIFMETILREYFSFEEFPKTHDREFQRSINVLRRRLLNQKEYRSIKTSFGFIVYGDNGKQTIINKVLPRLVSDIIGKIPDPVELFVVLDKDGTPLKKTVNTIYKNLKEKRISHTDVSILSKDRIVVKSSIDSRYQVIIRVYLIPESLEKQLVKCALSEIKLSSKKKRDLLSMDPHDALREISGMLNMAQDDIIGGIVVRRRFCRYEWFLEFIAEIKQFLDANGSK